MQKGIRKHAHKISIKTFVVGFTISGLSALYLCSSIFLSIEICKRTTHEKPEVLAFSLFTQPIQ